MSAAAATRNGSPAATQQQQRQSDTPNLDAALDATVKYTPFMETTPLELSPRMVLKYLCTPTKSGKVCDIRQAVRFVRLCQSRGLNPWQGDAYIVGYDGKEGPEFSLVTSHQAFLKRAETHPRFDGMRSGVIVKRPVDGGHETIELEGDYFDPADILMGGWATVYMKERAHPTLRRVRLTTFDKGYSRWKIDPAGMIVKVAEADALRSTFPNELGGMYLNDEIGQPQSVVPEPAKPIPAGRVNLRPAKQQQQLPDVSPQSGGMIEPAGDQGEADSGQQFADEPSTEAASAHAAMLPGENRDEKLKRLTDLIEEAKFEGWLDPNGVKLTEILKGHNVRTVQSLNEAQMDSVVEQIQRLYMSEKK
jgi:phage recombination protein Bet